MSQKQDLLFCKIAIANGRVTEAQAKQCLAIANKKEIETGRRPTIGSIFSKYNLMGKPEVLAIYEAIAKRTGIPVPSAGAPVAGGGRAGAAPRPGKIGRKASFADESRQRRVDPTVFWMGMAFGAIFLGIIITLVVMFITHEDPADKPEDGAPAVAGGPAGGSGTSPTGTSSPDASGGTGAAATGTAGATTGGANKPPAPVKAMSDSQRGKIRQVITDARHASLTNPQQALGMLKTLRTTINEKNILVDPGMLSEIDSDIKALETGDDGSEAAGGDADSGLDEDF